MNLTKQSLRGSFLLGLCWDTKVPPHDLVKSLYGMSHKGKYQFKIGKRINRCVEWLIW